MSNDDWVSEQRSESYDNGTYNYNYCNALRLDNV